MINEQRIEEVRDLLDGGLEVTFVPYLAYGAGSRACVSMDIEFGTWNFAPGQSGRARETIAWLVDHARVSLQPVRRGGRYMLTEVN